MNKTVLIVLGLAVVVGLVLAIFFLTDRERGSAPRDIVSVVDDYVDPSTIKDREELEQVRRLWPDVFEKDPRDPKQVEAEWKELAAKHPDNFYLPPQFRKPMDDDERKAQRARMEVYTDVAARFARISASSKYAEPGKDIPATEMTFTAEEQTTYFGYRMQELESRIQLLDFAMEKNGLDADQINRAGQERTAWQKELEELRNRAAQVKKEDAPR